jgi:hypothetical protein
MTGVASPDIREAERKLEEALDSVTATPPTPVYRRRMRKMEGIELVNTD